jgi:hypothetical protein
MRGILVSLVLVATLSTITAFDMTVHQQNSHEVSCHRKGGEFDMRQALDNSTLYEQVFQWMHQRDVEHWNYSTEDKYNGTTEMHCVLVSYNTLVASPTFFSRLLSNFHMSLEFPIRVYKEVCLSGHTLVESASISAPLIQEMTMRARYEVEEGKLTTVIETHYNLPWYINFLVYDLSEHLKTNLKEKVDAVATSLCAQSSTLTKLTSPLQRFSSQKLRRERATHPLHPPTQLHRASEALMKLHRVNETPMKPHPILEPPFHPPFNQKYF